MLESAPMTRATLTLTREQLFSRLRRRGERLNPEFDRRLAKDCGRELAVMMCDSSGFSRKTKEHGILQFLAVMVRVYDGLNPIVARRRGTVISQGADNLLAVFTDCDHAAAAALDMHRWLAKRNAGRPEAETFNICIGIHYGHLLRLRNDVFGDAVNVAAKVGEDLAGRDETLLTRDAASRLSPRYRAPYVRSTELGGRVVELHRLAAPPR